MLDWFPLEPDYLRFPWIADLTRMHGDPGLIPQWNATQAVQRFVEGLRTARYQRPAADQAYAADQLDSVMAQRRAAAQARARVDVL